MTTPAAIQGTFADLKTVKTRSVVQMIIEVPIEQGKQVVDAFGFPQPGSEIPVAVARLNPSAAKQEKPTRKPAATRAEKRHWNEMSRVQQAAIRCNNYDWRHWAGLPDTWGAEDVAQWLRQSLVIESRKELDTDPEKAAAWDALDGRFIEETRMATRTS